MWRKIFILRHHDERWAVIGVYRVSGQCHWWVMIKDDLERMIDDEGNCIHFAATRDISVNTSDNFGAKDKKVQYQFLTWEIAKIPIFFLTCMLYYLVQIISSLILVSFDILGELKTNLYGSPN